MPNHCLNVVKASGIRSWDIFRIYNKDPFNDLEKEFPIIDFQKIIPIEDDENWYDKHIDGWGTKWNAYYSYSDPSMLDEIDEDIIFFETAWGPCTPVIEALAKLHPDVLLEHESTDEFLQWYEKRAFLNGEEVDVHVYDECTNDFYLDLARGLWELAGIPKEDWASFGEEDEEAQNDGLNIKKNSSN